MISTKKTYFVFSLGYIFIVWMSKKQQIDALSSTKVEYIAISIVAREVAWLKKLTNDFGLHIN